MGVTTKSAKKNISHAACTPILSAVKYNHVNCVRELIELGANIFAKDSGNNNILHICASGFRNLQPLNGGGVHSEIKLDQADSLQMLDLLFSYEGDTILQMLYEENVKHQTPLRIAIDNNNADITKYLNQFYENGTHISRSNHTNDDPNYYVHTKSNPTFGHEDIGINDDEAVACVSKKKYKLSGTGQREPLVKNGASDRGINKKLPSRTVAIGNASNCGKSRNTSGVIGHSKKTNYFRKILPQNIVMDSKGNITAAEPVTPIIPTTQSDSTLNRSLSQMKANRETLNDMPICVPPHAYYSQQPMPHPLDTDSVLSALTTNSLPMGSVKASSEYKRNNVKSGSNTSQMVESEYNALDIFEASQ